ncbi:hypothetical protein GUITHDRAFT_83550, partial [Guillardia theta CCMP2712]
GRVKVNGKVVPPSWRLNGGDVLTLDDKYDLSRASPTRVRSYNKPMGVTSTMDKNDRRSLANTLVPAMLKVLGVAPRPNGISYRLDADSSGLLLLTDNGRLADSMLQPSKGKEKEYVVMVSPRINENHLKQLAAGVNITTFQQRDPGVKNSNKTRPCVVERANEEDVKRFVHFKEGRNRQIRKMCEALGYEVSRALRSPLIPAQIELGKLAVGEYRSLSDDEQARLLPTTRGNA